MRGARRAIVALLALTLISGIAAPSASASVASPMPSLISPSFAVPPQSAALDHIPVFGMLERPSNGARASDYVVKIVCSSGHIFPVTISAPRGGGLPLAAALPLTEVGAMCTVVAATVNAGQSFSFYATEVRPSTGPTSISSVHIRAMIVNHSGNGGL